MTAPAGRSAEELALDEQRRPDGNRHRGESGGHGQAVGLSSRDGGQIGRSLRGTGQGGAADDGQGTDDGIAVHGMSFQTAQGYSWRDAPTRQPGLPDAQESGNQAKGNKGTDENGRQRQDRGNHRSASRSTMTAVPGSKYSSTSSRACSQSDTVPNSRACINDGVKATSPVTGLECRN